MAQTRTVRPILGFTRFVQERNNVRPAGIIIQDTGGFDYYVWVDTSARLRITDAATAEAGSFNWNSGGTIVGTQS